MTTEFDKWIRGQDSLPAYPRYKTMDEDSAARDSWIAVLEWVLDMKKEDVYAGDVYNKAYHIPDWAVGLIEKELENLN